LVDKRAPHNSKWFISQEEVAKLQAERNAAAIVAGSHGIGKGGLDLQAAVFWASFLQRGFRQISDADNRLATQALG
jgi:hypothetical protein